MGIASELISYIAADGKFPLPAFDPAGGHNVEPGPDRDSSPPILLLVEDNPADVYVISRALRQCGIPILLRVAANGEQALSILRQWDAGVEQERPSLILLDWNLPGVSGAEVLAYIRQSLRLMNVPVVVVTSSDLPLDLAEIRRLGPAAHFRKPTDLDEYLDLKTIVLDLLPKRPTGRS